MKSFKDLEFKSHPNGIGLAGRIMFENGYGVSVVRFQTLGGYGSYTSNENEWELAVLKKKGEGWMLTFDTTITDDVIGHLLEEEVTEIMRKVQELPALVESN